MALGPDMGATVAETWQAHDAVMHARTEEWGTVGTAMAIRGVEASSSATYMQQVRMALRGCGTDEPLAVAIQRRFAELALRKRGYSAANNLVAGIRMLEKLKLIRATVTDLHRLQLRAIGKIAKAEDRPRVWATVADFQTLAERRVHWAWARVFFAVGMAFTICLRISDVAQLRWGWLAHKGWLVFFDYKVAKEMCAQPIPPFWERWRHWLYTHRRPHQHDENIFIPGGPDALRKLQTELFTGTECGLWGWHPWKRMGAACFRALGGSLPALALWARWRTPRQAARYAAHPPSWKMPSRVLLPSPVGESGHFTRDCEWTWMPVKELWHRDAFAWDLGRKRNQTPPTVHTFARPATPQEVDSESDDDEDLDDQDGECDQDNPDHEEPRREAENRSMQDAAQKEMGRDAELVPGTGPEHEGGPRTDEGTAGHGARPIEIIDVDELGDGETKMDANGDSGGAGAAEAVTAPEGAVASGADADRHERDAGDQASNEDRAGEDRRCGDADEAHMEDEPCQEMEASAEESGDDVGSEGSSAGDRDESSPGTPTCSTDCSESRWRLHQARRRVLGKRTTREFGEEEQRGAKRGRGETCAGDQQLVAMPDGTEADGAPHWGYLVTAPQRGHRFQLWKPMPLQCEREEQGRDGGGHGAADGGSGGAYGAAVEQTGTISGLWRDLAVRVGQRAGTGPCRRRRNRISHRCCRHSGTTRRSHGTYRRQGMSAPRATRMATRVGAKCRWRRRAEALE